VRRWRPALIALLSMVTSLAAAHTAIKSAVPANEAVLAASPAVIEISFEHLAQLTSVVVASHGQAPRKLAFEPLGNALNFKLTQPRLAPGRNEVRWKGLSSDGHVIEGTLVYTVAPSAASGATPPI
jgi:methionine-rich copper-binding protein CopC